MRILNVAVILAAGNGSRTGFQQPKQLVKLAGRPLVEHTIQIFQQSAVIDEILVVTNKECISRIEDMVMNQRFSKVKAVILGGKERYDSSLSAIAAYERTALDSKVNLIFHDAVRPLVSERIITDVVDALSHYNAVDVVIPSTDTIVCADPVTNTIKEIPDRTTLRNGQTPQGFALETIRAAYAIAMQDRNFKATDDCGVVLKYLPEEKIYLVDGEINNIKLTYHEDLQILDKLLQMRSSRLLNTVESKRFAELKNKVVVIFGGTSGIGLEIANLARAHQAIAISASRREGIDIRNLEMVQKFLAEVRKTHGRIDYIVNSAAVLSKQPLINMSPAEVLDAIQINYIGAVNVAVASFEHLRASQGHILNFTSSSYTYGRAHYSLYSSSKAAVVNLTQALAEEWHAEGVKVNCINPERTDTPMRRAAFGAEPEGTLLDARTVASQSLLVLLGSATGQVFDVRKS